MIALPLPRQYSSSGVLRELPERVLRVAGITEECEAIAPLVQAAYGVRIVADEGAPDVRILRGDVTAGDTVGADPREQGRAGVSEAYVIAPGGHGLEVRTAGAEGAFRALVTIAAAAAGGELPRLDAADAPGYSWRGLSLDVVRRWFPVEEVERIIDLLALHKLNVLHLHLTDTQGWRFAVPGRPALTEGIEHYTAEDLARLAAYAHERFVTIIPELDIPGHVAPTVGADAGVDVSPAPHPFLRYLEWNRDGVPELISDTLDELCRHFAGPYLHIGGDEAFGDPRESYLAFISEAVAAVRARGKRVVGWQETVRAHVHGEGDLVQLWIAERDRFDADEARKTLPVEYHPFIAIAAPLFAESVHDPELIAADGVSTIVSSSDPFYLDRRPSEPSRRAEQNETIARLGHPGYEATPSTDVLGWSAQEQPDLRDNGVVVAGVEAALWCESITSFDDAATLLLPRLGLFAQRAWGMPGVDRDEVLAAARAQASAWAALGFDEFFRSSLIFDD